MKSKVQLVKQFILTFPNRGLGVLVPQGCSDPSHCRSGKPTVTTKKSVENREARIIQAMATKRDVEVTLGEVASVVSRHYQISMLVTNAFDNLLAPETQKAILAMASELGLSGGVNTIRIPTESWTPIHVKKDGKKTKGKKLGAPRKLSTRPAGQQPSP